MGKEFEWKIKAAVLGWLRYERGCFLVCWERSPFDDHRYRPDICGVNKRRFVIEVEVKQTLSDFKANSQKKTPFWPPSQFYFAVPRALVSKVLPITPEKAGLLTLAELDSKKWGPQVSMVKSAAVNPAAIKVSNFGIGRMIRHQTGTLQRAVLALARYHAEH